MLSAAAPRAMAHMGRAKLSCVPKSLCSSGAFLGWAPLRIPRAAAAVPRRALHVAAASSSALDSARAGLKLEKESGLMLLSGDGLAARAGVLGGLEVVDLGGDPGFVKPMRLTFKQGERERTWECVSAHSSVAVILYHREMEAAIVVRQFRPAVYLSECRDEEDDNLPFERGFTYECCAGIIDKDKPLEQIAREEVLEECGYDVPLDSIRRLTSYSTAVGLSGARQTFFFAEIDESMHLGGGGGLEHDGEAIDVLAVPNEGMAAFAADEGRPKSAGLIWALSWLQTQYPAPQA